MKCFGIRFFLLIWPAVLVVFGCPLAFAQQMQRPDAGTLQEPQRQPPLLPQPGEPQISLPWVKPPSAPDRTSVRITPAAFRFEGNTLIDSERLSAVLTERVNQPTDLAGLNEAARLISGYYRSRGYFLTEAYLPEQAFATTGGTVLIAVIEARVGRVTVQLEGEGISETFAKDLVAGQIRPGDAITEYGLDKPVLLLRDLAGFEASATVEPGDRAGLVNVLVTVRAKGTGMDGSLGLDNHGARAAGALRAIASANLNNLLGRGDVLAVSAQQSSQSGSSLYRIGYTLPIGSAGTRLGLNAVRLDYALGKQFEALGATGQANIVGLSLLQPLLRGRAANLHGLITAEQKKLLDQTATPAQTSQREIVALRFGLAGNFVDTLADRAGLNNYAVNATVGKLTLSPADQALDAGLGGLRTAGSFRKINLDYQRIQLLGSAASIYFMAQAQLASKNLSSAEKMVLGGPNGVRGYPVGEGVGDSGTLVTLEYRYPLPLFLSAGKEPISLLAFYDYGWVRFNQNGASVPGAVNSVSLGSVGLGATLGHAGRFLIKTHLAWRTTPALPSTGDADRTPRAWLSAQTWF